MSRIHEALKQASQGKEPPPLADLVTPISSAEAAATRSSAAPAGDWLNLGLGPEAVRAGTAAVSFSSGLEDLWKQCVKREWKLDPAYSVFSGKNPSRECAEQFRKLRARLYETRGTDSMHTVLVTSAVPGEGKTFVALNLALAMARQHGRRVLLIDGDLRAPKLASCLGVPAAPGLAEFVCGAADETAIVQTDSEGSLFAITGGNMLVNPTEMLGSERFQWLLTRMAPLFDWVIVDAPPVLPVSDSTILARHCDGVLLVVRAGATGFDAVGSALQEIRGKKLLGVVLNRADKQEIFDRYSYYAEDAAPQPA